MKEQVTPLYKFWEGSNLQTKPLTLWTPALSAASAGRPGAVQNSPRLSETIVTFARLTFFDLEFADEKPRPAMWLVMELADSIIISLFIVCQCSLYIDVIAGDKTISESVRGGCNVKSLKHRWWNWTKSTSMCLGIYRTRVFIYSRCQCSGGSSLFVLFPNQN